MYGQETSIMRRRPIFTNHDGAGNWEGLVTCEGDPLDARGGKKLSFSTYFVLGVGFCFEFSQ